MKQLRRIQKRILSMLLVVVFVFSMLPMVSFAEPNDQEQENKEEQTQEPENTSRVRLVVNNISELPQANIGNYLSFQRGAKERPFFILEVVPAEQFAEFGYLIGGCEPLDFSKIPEDNIQGVLSCFGLDNFYKSDEDNGWHNKETFLTDTLGLSYEEAASYSVAIKTITPDELNRNPDWINYADLISISPNTHIQAGAENWTKYNRLNHSAGSVRGIKNEFLGNDISAEVALKIYNKVTLASNFAGIIIDDNVYNIDTWNTQETLKEIDYKVYDRYLSYTNKNYTIKGSTNNVYKLSIMLLSMKSGLFKTMYLNGSDPKVKIENGVLVNTLQSGDARSYFSPISLLFVVDTTVWNSNYDFWISDFAWENYDMTIQITNMKNWTMNHVYTYPGGTNISQSYMNESEWNVNSKCTDYKKYVNERNGANTANTSDAIRYILNLNDNNEITLSKVKVLDLEPVTELDSNNYKPKWQLTEQQVRLMLNGYTGDIEIVHQTTSAFNSKIEDINSEYQMIYIGTDIWGYHTRQITGNFTMYGKTVNMTRTLPDYNDDKLDGKIYTHTGDYMYSAEMIYGYSNNKDEYRVRSVKIVDGVNYPESQVEARFSGNDITLKKYNELLEYAKSGSPIVVGDCLYDLDQTMIDANSYIYKLIEAGKQNASVLATTNVGTIGAKVANSTVKVVFEETPVIYSGTTSGSGQISISDATNLSRTANGYPLLNFQFYVNKPNYVYDIYIDEDRNSKFESYEKKLPRDTSRREWQSDGKYYQSCTVELSSRIFGAVNWKIVVRNVDNEYDRYVKTGISSVKYDSRYSDVKKINVLQIMPNSSNMNYNGALDLSSSTLFKKYYENLDDYGYDISIVSIKWDTFNDIFKDNKYSYVYDSAAGKLVGKCSNNPSFDVDQYSFTKDGMTYMLNTFNMIIVGFGDTYNVTDISNKNGAMYWIQHYIDSGKSILMTHDNTSLYSIQGYENTATNQPNTSKGTVFGSTPNAMLRERLGMNRYGMLSRNISTVFGDKASEKWFIENNKDNNGNLIVHDKLYDTGNLKASQATQGYTYYAMRRYGISRKYGDYINTNSNNIKKVDDSNYGKLFPYRQIGQLNDGHEYADANDTTTHAEQVNRGQITSFPYKITEADSEQLSVASTHGQYFQLNLEDSEVTVWYTLTNTGKNGLTYSVSPSDGANNYYIYSKGNVFYSGVGHSTVSGDAEAKLFVNTMVAAAAAGYEPPVVDVVNNNVMSITANNYAIEIMQEYNNEVQVDGSLRQNADTLAGMYDVEFVPYDYNIRSTAVKCTIKIGNRVIKGSDGLVSAADGSAISMEGDSTFVLASGKRYKLKYNLDYMNQPETPEDKKRSIIFTARNTLVDEESTTVLRMSIQPLFILE